MGVQFGKLQKCICADARWWDSNDASFVGDCVKGVPHKKLAIFILVMQFRKLQKVDVLPHGSQETSIARSLVDLLPPRGEESKLRLKISSLTLILPSLETPLLEQSAPWSFVRNSPSRAAENTIWYSISRRRDCKSGLNRFQKLTRIVWFIL